MLKKYFSLLICIAMIFTTIVIPKASQTATITVESVNVVQGTTTVDVKIDAKNNPGLVFAKFNVTFGDFLTLTEVTDGGLWGSTNHSNNKVSPYVLYWNNGTATSDFTADGTIATLTFSIPTDIATGTYPILLSVVQGSTFNYSDEDVEFSVANGGITVTEAPKADFTGITLANKTYTYDGVEKGMAVSGTVPGGATVTYTYDNSTTKPTEAGTYAVKATVSKSGYNNLVLNATMTINPKNLTVSGMSASNKVYDGTTDATVSGGTLNGKVTGDEVEATFPTTGTFASANVGNGIAVSVPAVTLSGADKDNYTLTQPTGLKANITKRSITVTAKSYTIRQNTAVPALEYDITSGSMVSGETLTGALSVNANGTRVGTFDITKGTLAASNNYSMTFVKGTLTVSAKDVQDVTVANIPAKTYGDDSFALEVTDNSTALGELTYTSSNADVATVSADGTVTVKTAGTTNITVSRAGNEQYADFSVTKPLTVNKKAITITAKSYTIRQNNVVPTLEYDITAGELETGDAITGALTVNADGTRLGEFDITQGTLTAGANYALTFVKGKLSVVDKTPQEIVVAIIGEKTYGDADFAVSVTPDATANLSAFAYASSNTDVAEISAGGTVTIKAAGKTDITVTEPGNADYAAFINTQKLVVNKKNVTVTSVDLDAKTAVLDGVLSGDTTVALNFDKLVLEITGEVDETTSNVTVTGFELVGDKSENYVVTTTELNTTIATDNVVTVTVTADGGTVTGAGSYIKGNSVTVIATPIRGFAFTGWQEGETTVSTDATYTFVADADKELVAKFVKQATGGGDSTYTVNFETNGGSKVSNKSVRKNTSVTEPAMPSKKGYTFAGWYSDAEFTTPYDFSDIVKKDMTLYAKWTAVGTVEPEPTEKPEEPATTPFNDVKADAWYADAVKFAVENGLMNGVSDTEFAPNNTLTRAMLVTILYRNDGEPETAGDIAFEDVSDGAYYENAVAWAKANGIVDGVSDTEFAPDANITREQIAAIMHRYATYKNYDVSGTAEINDRDDYAEISEYAVSAIQYMVASGLMNGKTNTTLEPQDKATRAEIATILQRFITSNN